MADAEVVVLATPVRTLLRQLPEVGRTCATGRAHPGPGQHEVGRLRSHEPPARRPAAGRWPPDVRQGSRRFRGGRGRAVRRERPSCSAPCLVRQAQRWRRHGSLAEAVGSYVVTLDPQAHDRAVAAISHLPYLAAAGLVNAVSTGNDPLAWALAASGFRDTTRVAASDVQMMLDILMTNRVAVLDWLHLYMRELAGLRDALESGNEDELRARLVASAQELRSRLHS